ncbi:MAG: hypothetical protein AB1489_22030, partial [Acidobacteriota bacterium]
MSNLTAVCINDESPWHQLSEKQQRVVITKLVSVNDATHPCQTELNYAQERFNTIINETILQEKGSLDPQAIRRAVLNLENLLAGAGAFDNSRVWQQIGSIDKIWAGLVELTILDRSAFLNALKSEGYAVNHRLERLVRLLTGYGHPNDSARKISDSPRDYSLHFANDDIHRPNTYFVHWDATSVFFRRGESIF